MEIRNNSVTIEGYVNAVKRDSKPLPSSRGKFVEQIEEGVFSKALEQAENVDLLFNHNESRKLGSIVAGNLKLIEDAIGLKATTTITDPEVVQEARDGKLTGWSFGFRCLKDKWVVPEKGVQRRFVEALELLEVSILNTTPAYNALSLEVRSEETIETRDYITEIRVVEEVKEQELPLDVHAAELRLNIMKAEDTVRSMESMSKVLSDNTSLPFVLEREKQRLNGLKSEFEDIKKQMEEIKMNDEKRTLQGTTEGQSTVSQQVAPIWELLEASSNAVIEARKIELIGSNMKIPYETALDDAAFVLEGEDIPTINLNLDNRDTLAVKRVGVMQKFSKFLLDDSKGLDEHSKKLLVRRVGKKIEEEILTGDNVKGLKGIAPDTLVPSVDFAINPSDSMLRALYLKVNSEYRPYCKWYMSEAYFEKVAQITVNGEYLVKSKTVDGKAIPTLWEHEIQISSTMQSGGTIDHTPIIFASIANCYTLAIAKDIEVNQAVGAVEALKGLVSFKAEALLDGSCHNYQAVAKGVVA